MAVAVLPNSTPSISNPFLMPSRQHLGVGDAPAASSSRTSQQRSSSGSPLPVVPEPVPKAFQRIRTSLEQSLRSAARRPRQLTPAVDEPATITPATSKGKQKAISEEPPKEKEKSNMLKRFEVKVNFRRAVRESITTPSVPPPISKPKDAGKNNDPTTPNGSGAVGSLRQASISSPTLLAPQQPLHSRRVFSPSPPPKLRSPIMPSRDRSKDQNIPQQSPKDAPVVRSRRYSHTNGVTPPDPSRPTRDRSQGHKVSHSSPVNIPSSPSSPSLLTSQRPLPQTPPRRMREPPSPPQTPTPPPGSRSNFAYSSKRYGASSSGHLPISSSPGTPTTIRGISPIRTRSPTSRMRVTPPRGFPSSSSSHLPPSPTTPTSRRPSVESQRRPSGSGSRANSPSSPILRGTSPISYSKSRHFNASTVSLSLPSNPEQRELIRNATSLLCKELLRSPHPTQREAFKRDWREVEPRMRLLMRHEKFWGKNAGSGIAQPSSNAEEKERKLFGEALKDGVVLCLVMNKLRSASVVLPDLREDGVKRTSNVNKFLAACASYGLSSRDLFNPDDLKEGSGESLARVAHTLITLVKFVDAPVDRSKYISGQGKSSSGNPYSPGTSSRAAASTPNLSTSHVHGPSSPIVPSTPTNRKRWSPSADLPPVRSNSPEEGTSGGSSNGETGKRDRPDLTLRVDVGNDRVVNGVPLKPPPRSPFRTSSTRRLDDDVSTLFTLAVKPTGLSSDRASVADSTRVLVPNSTRTSLADPTIPLRQSVASGTTTTDATMISSLLEVRHNSNGNTKYGTIRTVTTEATSETPSFTRAEGGAVASFIADETAWRGAKYSRERRPSETAVIDLSRLEEVDESSSSSKGGHRVDKGTVNARNQEKKQEPERVPIINLGKGKFPEDFIGVRSQPRAIPSRSQSTDRDDPTYMPRPSISPPRKLAVVASNRRNESLESLPQFPRRPTQRVRHSLDQPGLLPKEFPLRDSSPDGIPSASSRVMLRRHSTKPSGQRNGIYLPRGSYDDPRNSNDSGDSLVPFPRAVSGEHGPASPSPSSSFDSRPVIEPPGPHDRPRLPRGRFQSDIEGSTRRARPSSYDEIGRRRSRFESMVNLGVATSNASASDLMNRDSVDGSVVRKTLIIKEEGKPPTHFQLGNCIGRGQFGSVYRALNLNTGQMVAVKRIRLEGLKEEEVTQLMKEVDLVKSLSHPSIVKYEGMSRDDGTLNIVLEYAENGSLGQILKAFGKLNERLVASYVVKILEGLYYLHQCEVVHCDLKAANILTTKNGNIKLSDFGVSLNLRAMEREKDVAGTPNWMAPEVIELKGASTKSDIWSLGCTVIELFTGRPPYAEMNSMAVMFRIVEDKMPPIPEECTPLLRDFLTQCFNKDPTKRPNAEMLCEHEWLKKNLAAHKELRRQDSIPFLRRVSADYQKAEAVRSQIHIEIPESESPQPDGLISPLGRRYSNDLEPISPREHAFVKTIFEKVLICKVCLLGVKKNAVLCKECKLIAHSKCSSNAPPTCDFRAQLLLHAQYATRVNPGSQYSNPLHNNSATPVPTSPTSEGSYATGTPRTSVDNASPPTAFKRMATAFKRSKSSLSPEPGQSSSLPTPSAFPREEKRKPAVLKRKEQKVRPQSLASDSTTANTSSLRSAATAAESFSSRLDARTSVASALETETGMSGSGASLADDSEAFRSAARMAEYLSSGRSANQEDTRMEDSIPTETRSQKKRNKESKSGACAIQ